MRSLPSGAGYGASGFLSCVGIKRSLPNYPTLSGRPCSMPLLLRPNKKETGKSRAKRASANSGYRVIASGAKQSLREKEITSSPAAPRNDTTLLVFKHALSGGFHEFSHRSVAIASWEQKENG